MRDPFTGPGRFSSGRCIACGRSGCRGDDRRLACGSPQCGLCARAGFLSGISPDKACPGCQIRNGTEDIDRVRQAPPSPEWAARVILTWGAEGYVAEQVYAALRPDDRRVADQLMDRYVNAL